MSLQKHHLYVLSSSFVLDYFPQLMYLYHMIKIPKRKTELEF